MSDSNDDPAGDERQVSTMRQARMLDLRLYICALFLIFGVVVTVTGIFASQAELAKASGININLWAGISMLILSAVFGIWAIAIPPSLPANPPKTEAGG